MLKGGHGALVISDIILGVGAINTQAWWYPENQKAARERMKLGETPEKIIDWLIHNDNSTDGHTIGERQYGIVAIIDGERQTAAYTGSKTKAFADHITGPNYSIQGNILSDASVLRDMQRSFLNTKGTLANKLMAAMQGAKRIGADSRCRKHG
jgi:uncharacterized Ntn-hydrolase superfamily protein